MNDFFSTLSTLIPWDGKTTFGLENILLVLSSLNNPQDQVPSIHVTGTNGKGSTSAMIASGLGAAGFRVGLTISPHLERLNERFVIDGIPVNDNWINTYGEMVKNAWETCGVVLSYHEALTALGFVGFAHSNLDYMVVEVGLGGRLDATNCMAQPIACVITSIGMDHQEVLGGTLDAIAREKAGIIKAGTSVVIGEMDGDIQFVIGQACVEKRAILTVPKNEASIIPNKKMKVALPGDHQRKNAAIASEVLRSVGISNDAIELGLSQVFWPGRLEYVTVKDSGKRILLDCAHNPHGMQSLEDYLNENTIGKIHLIYGSLEHKDWRKSLNILNDSIDTFCYFEPDSTKALSQCTMRQYVEQTYPTLPFVSLGKNYSEITNYIKGLNDNKLILLTGSIYLIGKLRSLLDIPFKPLWTRTYN